MSETPEIERVGRAVRRSRFERTSAGRAFDPDLPLTENELNDARAAIAAYHAALQDDGLVIVPREATEKMRRVGADGIDFDERVDAPETDIASAWRAMVAVALSE